MVRVGFPGGPRLEWYDRNPIAKSQAYNGSGVAPHSMTVRATYTVPTGKKALIAFAEGVIVRVTAATAVGWVEVLVQGANNEAFRLNHINNTVNSYEQGRTYVGYVLLAGQDINLQTQDLSTGGTLSYNVFITSMEFSA